MLKNLLVQAKIYDNSEESKEGAAADVKEPLSDEIATHEELTLAKQLWVKEHVRITVSMQF